MKQKELKKSEKFEYMVSQIVSLLEGENTEVSWNEKIPDPDNPSQNRQVDVLVRNNDLLTLIECRLHSKRQDVKWIEELIGRQISLGAHAIIGVSSSGFTQGAIAKANKFGINLRTIDKLTEDEITSWGKTIKLSLFYWKPTSLTLNFYFEKTALNRLNTQDVMNALKVHPYLQDILSAHFKFKDITKLKLREKLGEQFHFKGSIFIENFILCNALVKKIDSECCSILQEISLTIPQVLLFKKKNDSCDKVYIQNFNLGETRVIHNGKNISINLDISNLDLPPLCQFQFVDFHSDETVNIEYFELIGVEKMRIKSGEFNLTLNAFVN